jgi:putative SOS response-associated peptidase YedK
MCGRFTLTASIAEIAERFSAEYSFKDEDYSSSYNIAPSQSVLAVINDGQTNRMGFLRWGLIPPWAKDVSIGHKLVNARAETLTEKPSYRHAFQKKRCLIVADSFYEWKRVNNQKIPMRILLKSHELFSMVGLWEQWKSPNGDSIFSCTIITTKPNPLMASIHDRMPVILKPQDEPLWLDPTISDPKKLKNLLKPYDEQWMEAYEVSQLVNSPKNNSPDLIQPID